MQAFVWICILCFVVAVVIIASVTDFKYKLAWFSQVDDMRRKSGSVYDDITEMKGNIDDLQDQIDELKRELETLKRER